MTSAVEWIRDARFARPVPESKLRSLLADLGWDGSSRRGAQLSPRKVRSLLESLGVTAEQIDRAKRDRLVPLSQLRGAMTDLYEPPGLLSLSPFWYVDARQSATMIDLVGDLDAAEPSPPLLDSSVFDAMETPALVGGGFGGGAQSDAGTSEGDWPAATFDLRLRAGKFPQDSTGGDTHPVLFTLPVAGTDNLLAWLELSFWVHENGDIGVKLDSGGDGGDGPYVQWESDPLGDDWHDAIDATDWRVTGDLATGEVTVYRDGIEVLSATLGEVSLPEPPDGNEIDVSLTSGTANWFVESVTLLDAIDGDPIISFDADDPTGWTVGPNSQLWTADDVAALPTRRCFDATGGPPGLLADDPMFDLQAEVSKTIVFAYRPDELDAAAYASNNVNGVGAGGAGWGIVHVSGYGIPYSFLMSDSGVPGAVLAQLGDQADEDQLIVVTVDRDLDLVTGWRNGEQTDQADISAIGDIIPAAPTGFVAFVYAAAIFERVLSDDEIASLNDLLLPA